MFAATFAIVIASAPAAPVPDRVSDLVRTLKTGKPGERVIAAEALGDLGPAAADAIPVLAAAVRETRTHYQRFRRGDSLPKPGTREHGERYLFFAARDALVRIGPKAIPALGELLTHEDTDARREILEVLERLGPGAKDAVPALVKALADPDGQVRMRAAWALRKIGPDAEPAIPELVKAALRPKHDAIEWDREGAIKALIAIGPKAAPALREKILPAAVERIETADCSYFAIEALAEALGEKGEPMVKPIVAVVRGRDRKDGTAPEPHLLLLLGPAGRKACAELLADGGRTVRQRVLTSLLRTHGEALLPAVPALLTLVKDGDRPTRLAAVEVLGRLYEKAPPEAIASVAALADDPKFLPLKRDERVQSDALKLGEALSRFGKGARPVLVLLLKSESPAGRAVAARALGAIRADGRDALPALRALSADPFLFPALEAAYAAACISLDAKDLAPLVRLLGHSDAEVRLAAIEKLRAFTPLLVSYQKELLERLDDPDKWVKREAAGVILNLGPAAPEAVDALARRLAELRKDPLLDSLGVYSKFGPAGKPAVRGLIAELGSDSEYSDDKVCLILAGIGPDAADAVPALTRRLGKLGTSRPDDTLEALGAMGAAAKPAVPHILKLLDGAADRGRLAVVRCLGEIGPAAKEAIPDLKALLTDPNPEVRLVAAYALARITGDAAPYRPVFERLLRTRPAGSRPGDLAGILRPVVNPLERLASHCPELLSVAIAALPEMSSGVRKGTLVGLGKFGPAAADAVPALLTILAEEEYPGPRAEICEALGAIGPKAKAALPKLRELVANERLWVALAAQEAIRKIEAGK